MKLLIVDDEELTRNGLLSSISWSNLGITEVFQADDGVNGLSSALKNKPEIILCDVRMPRMDGIQMVENLQGLLPDTVVIFMSGYSDKEYLKAAIKLKAINYVEKPLNLSEIREAVLEAAKNYNQKQLIHRGETWHYQETSEKLALQLTLPYEKSNSAIHELCKTLSLKDSDQYYFTSFLIKLPGDSTFEDEIHQVFSLNLNQFLDIYHASSLMAKKHQNYIVFFVLNQTRPSDPFISELSSFFLIQISKYGKAFICRGKTVSGINNAYQSFESAVILMQSSFFFPANTVLTPELLQTYTHQENTENFFSHDYAADFADALSAKDREKCAQVLDILQNFFELNTQTFYDQVRDTYYKFFTILQNICRRMKIADSDTLSTQGETIISYLEHFDFFKDLHTALVNRTNDFFLALENRIEENPTIFLIRQYINQNYRRETLSVKDISEHVYLSASYVCTLFKTETGQTLNQYITEYRMERAKILLQDSRYKIADISAKVGYSDGNYFGKTFKKTVGLSPSEYREKMTT